jgi:para-nitrobenzyl esterase
VMGESAGGISVMALLTSPKAKGLFQRAIVLSGGGRTFLLGGKKLTGGSSIDPSADQIGSNFAESVGVRGDGPQALGALRALPADTIIGGLSSSTYVDGPIIDNRVVIAIPQLMLRRGAMAKVPIMIGSTAQDLVAILPPSPDNPLSYFGADSDKARAVYNPDGKLDPAQVRSVVGEDMTMHEPARFVAKQMTKAGMPVWLYRFGYVAETMRSRQAAALHASEIPFLFNTLEKTSYSEDVTEKDRTAANDFNRYVVNFAKSGQPNGQGLPKWPRFDALRSELMAFTPDNGPIGQLDPWKDRLDLVEQAADSVPHINRGGRHSH